MSRNPLFVLAAIVVATPPSGAPAADTADVPRGYEGYRVVRITVDDQLDVDLVQGLERLGEAFQVWSEIVRPGDVEVRLAPQAVAALDATGLKYTVVVDDLQRHIDDLYSSARGGFFDSLQTYTAHADYLAALAEQYPDLAQLIDVGQSVEGRTIWGLRISGAEIERPAVFYFGAQHGNEQAAASLTTYIADYLLSNYATDPEVARLVDRVEWFLVPIANPDGYTRFSRYNVNNVDLNRNWGGPGAGSNPFSQPETAALRDFIIARPQIRLQLDIHGYVYWFLWPWGHTADDCPDHETFLTVGLRVRDLIQTEGGGFYQIGSAYDVAYPIIGGSNNYTYGVHGIWGYTLELPDSNVPQATSRFLSSCLFLASWVFDCNENLIPDTHELALGTSTDCNGSGTLDECEVLPDCNENSVADACDIYFGISGDCNANLIPDECDLLVAPYADCNQNQELDVCELVDNGDFDNDGVVTLTDYAALPPCFRGPKILPVPPIPQCTAVCAAAFDLDHDFDVDLRDIAHFANLVLAVE